MIGNVTAAGAPNANQANAFGGLDSEAFMKLLVAQLRFQNPMEPSDPSAMMQQTATFTQVETLKQLATAQQQLLGLSQAAISAGLVGKEVSAQAADGSLVTGVVDGVRFSETGPILLVGDTDVPLEAATAIRSPRPAASEATT